MSKTEKHLTVEGEPLKRYRLSYWGSPLGSYGTAKQAREAYTSYEKIRPMIDREGQGRYSIRDGNKEITLRDLRQAAAKE